MAACSRGEYKSLPQVAEVMYVLKNKLYLSFVFLIDFFGYIISFPFRIFRRRKLPRRIRRILIIRLDHIGDVVAATVVPKNLKIIYPDARIDFLVGGWAKDLVASNPYIDRVILFDAPWFQRPKRKVIKTYTFLGLARIIRANKYDLGLDLRGDLRHILLMFLGGVKFRVSYGITGGSFLLQRKVKYRKDTPAIEHNLDLLRGIGIEPLIDTVQLYSSTQDENWVNDFFILHNLKETDFIVVIHAYSGNPCKNWADEKFVELMLVLYYKYRFKILLLGSDSDREANEELIRLSSIPAINLAGKASLGAVLALLKKTNAFIGVDSGPGHIAASTGKPAIILYSGTNRRQEWAPLGSNVVIIQKRVPCEDCQKLDCRRNICMDLISVNEVLVALKEAARL